MINTNERQKKRKQNLKEQKLKVKEQAAKAQKDQNNSFSALHSDREDDMDDDTEVFKDSFSDCPLPKDTLLRLLTT